MDRGDELRYHRVELVSADLVGLLERITGAGVEILDVKRQSALCAVGKILPGDLKVLENLCRKRGDQCTVLRAGWGVRGKKAVSARPVLVVGILALILLTLLLPRRILFLEVVGNETLSEARILEAAQAHGLYFGVPRKLVRSEKIKNALLEEIPQLQYAGVNTRGCVGVIQVRERKDSHSVPENSGYGHVVALRDGIVTDCTAYRGNLLCAVGQAVTEGQILISGYTDSGLLIRAEQAGGEIYAQTNRVLQMKFPLTMEKKQGQRGSKRRISLVIGKKRINLWKNSGIYQATCDRMYKEYYVTLPGGFRLPLRLVSETFAMYAPVPSERSEKDARELLETLAKRYLITQMNTGRIQSASVLFFTESGWVRLAGEYHCVEMIGKMQRFQIGEENE